MGTYQRLYHQFKDIKENEYLLEIYKTGYSSSYNIKYQESESITLEHGGNAKDQWDFTYILGQELRCVLYVPRDDVSVIDDILESEYKDWNVKLTKGATILFQGFLKPENVYKRFEIKPPYIEFELSATDGLADLKDVDFNQPGDSDDIATTTISLLQAVKYALTQVGIPLPFCIQINTYESTYMNFDDCPLTSIFCNTKRFYSKDDTKYKPIKCWDALEIVLKIFNAKLFQYDGHYYIVNFHEIISNGYFYDWGLSLIEKTSTGTKIDISSYLYAPYVEQQKIQPLKSVLLTIENSDPGQELQDFTDYENVWEFDVRNGNASNLHHGINTAGNLVLNMSAYGEPYMQLKSDMNIVQKYPDYDEYLRVSFKYRMIYYNKNKAGMNYTSPKIAVERGDVWTKYSKANAPTKSWQEYDSFADSKFIISQDGTYNIEINIDSRYGKRQFDEFSLEIADLNITQYVPAINKQYNPTQVNADVTYKQINVKGYEDLELDAKLFDSLLTSEDAALLISDGANLVCTALWYIYYGTTAMKIVDACSRYILLNRSRYKNFLKCTIIDRDYLITMNCVLIIQSRYYVFNSYLRNFQLGEIEAELVELITTDVEGSIVEDDIDDYPTIEDDTLKTGKIPTNTGTEDDVEVVDVEAHGFVVGDVIRIEDGDSSGGDIEYYLAQADSIAHATAIGVVSEIIDEDTFRYISFGLLPIEVFDVTAGLYYYLSPTNPGKMVTSPTYEEYEIEQAIGFGTDKGLYVEIDARNLNFKSMVETSLKILWEVDSLGNLIWQIAGDSSWYYLSVETTVETSGSVIGTGDASDPISLEGDEDDPGANMYYGTDDSSVPAKGFHELPLGSDEKVKLAADDTTAGYLTPKLAEVDSAAVDDTSTFNFVKTVESVATLVKITWVNLKTAIKSYTDTLYYAFGIYEDIAFDFNDITAGTAQTYVLDIKVSFAYTIESCVLESDGSLEGVSVKIGATAVGGMDNLSVSVIAETTASGSKTTAAGDAVTLNTSTGYSGTPTLIRGKLKLKRVAS
ncbi:MAG: hypothetical protein M0R17_11520 [Candidatus Omnitrophica bacterium]|jgi:hypothetical protein|nr:hypothetical protein [Candidatus Omnitrophota bacterium]